MAGILVLPHLVRPHAVLGSILHRDILLAICVLEANTRLYPGPHRVYHARVVSMRVHRVYHNVILVQVASCPSMELRLVLCRPSRHRLNLLHYNRLFQQLSLA